MRGVAGGGQRAHFHEKEVIKEVPVERVVTREVPVEVPVDRVVVKEVVVPVETIVVKEVEVQVEKVVVKEVPVPVEVPYQVIVNQEIPVEKIVIKEIPVPIDRVIKEVVEIPVQKLVERFIEIPVEKPFVRIVEVPTERIVFQDVEIPIEKVVIKEVPLYVERVGVETMKMKDEIQRPEKNDAKSESLIKELMELRQKNEKLQAEINILRFQHEQRPTLICSRISSTSAKLQWTAIDGAKQYVAQVQASAIDKEDAMVNETDFKTFYTGPCLECIATDLDPESKLYFRVCAESGQYSSLWSLSLCVLMEDKRFPELKSPQLRQEVEYPARQQQQISSNWTSPVDRQISPRRQTTPSTAVNSPDFALDSALSPADAQWRKVSHAMC